MNRTDYIERYNINNLEEFVDTSDFVEAKFIASEWHSGQWSALYMLSCGKWYLWTLEDIESMITEAEEITDDDAKTTIIEAMEVFKEYFLSEESIDI